METAKNKTFSASEAVSFHSLWTGLLKRAFDVITSAIGLLVLLPFFTYIALLIKRECPGPVFYRGSRSGRYGKEFGILKFRTMYERPEFNQYPRVTAKDDVRITPLGKWLRDTKINELPQLWNVLVGEMSLVGPRPEDPTIVETWSEEARREILSVRPGITSPASVLYRNEEKMLSADHVMDTYLRDILPDKLRLDRLYVRHGSLLKDLDVLFWTAVALIPRLGNYHVPEGRLFAGPIYRTFRRNVSWFFLDLVANLASVVLVVFSWRIFAVINWGLWPLASLALALAFLFSFVNFLLGLDRVFWSRATADDGLALVMSDLFSVLIPIMVNTSKVLQAWFPLPPLPNGMLIFVGVISLAFSLFMRYRLRLITSIASRWLNWRESRVGFGERVLILGAGEGGQIAHWLLNRGTLRQAFTVVGMVDDDPAKQGMRVGGSRVLGSIRDLPDLVRVHDVGVILFAISHLPPEAHYRFLQLCYNTGVRVVFMNDILGIVQNRLSYHPRPGSGT